MQLDDIDRFMIRNLNILHLSHQESGKDESCSLSEIDNLPLLFQIILDLFPREPRLLLQEMLRYRKPMFSDRSIDQVRERCQLLEQAKEDLSGGVLGQTRFANRIADRVRALSAKASPSLFAMSMASRAGIAGQFNCM